MNPIISIIRLFKLRCLSFSLIVDEIVEIVGELAVFWGGLGGVSIVRFGYILNLLLVVLRVDGALVAGRGVEFILIRKIRRTSLRHRPIDRDFQPRRLLVWAWSLCAAAHGLVIVFWLAHLDAAWLEVQSCLLGWCSRCALILPIRLTHMIPFLPRLFFWFLNGFLELVVESELIPLRTIQPLRYWQNLAYFSIFLSLILRLIQHHGRVILILVVHEGVADRLLNIIVLIIRGRCSRLLLVFILRTRKGPRVIRSWIGAISWVAAVGAVFDFFDFVVHLFRDSIILLFITWQVFGYSHVSFVSPLTSAERLCDAGIKIYWIYFFFLSLILLLWIWRKGRSAIVVIAEHLYLIRNVELIHRIELQAANWADIFRRQVRWPTEKEMNEIEAALVGCIYFIYDLKWSTWCFYEWNYTGFAVDNKRIHSIIYHAGRPFVLFEVGAVNAEANFLLHIF